MTAPHYIGASSRPLPLPRVLTTTTAAAAGLTKARVRTELRNGRWRRLAPGVYLTRPEDPTRTDWARVGLAVAGPHAVVSGWDAVRRYGLGPDLPPTEDVLVLARGGTHRLVRDDTYQLLGGVWIRPSARHVARRYPRSADAYVRRIPVAPAARAIADVALVFHRLEPVRAMVTEAVQRGLCTPDQLAVELDAGPRNGSAHLRRAVEDVHGGARSISEAEAADVLRAGNLPPLELNVPIVDETGEVLYVADALWRDLRAVLEIDSRKHHFLEPAWERTMVRHNALARFGLAVTHYPPRTFGARPVTVQVEVEAWLRVRAAELAVPYVPVRNQRPRRTPPEPFRVSTRR